MNIEIKVTGGTVRNARFELVINGSMTGELTMDRSDFTKFCDLLFKDGYVVSGKVASKMSE